MNIFSINRKATENIWLAEKTPEKPVVVGILIILVSFLHDNIKFVSINTIFDMTCSVLLQEV